MTPSKIYLVYCPTCEDYFSIEEELFNAEAMKWKHYWKSKEGHVREDDIEISEYHKTEVKIKEI